VISMFPTPGTERLRSHVFDQMMNTPQYVLRSTIENSVDAKQPPWELQNANVPVLVLNAKKRDLDGGLPGLRAFTLHEN